MGIKWLFLYSIRKQSPWGRKVGLMVKSGLGSQLKQVKADNRAVRSSAVSLSFGLVDYLLQPKVHGFFLTEHDNSLRVRVQR